MSTAKAKTNVFMSQSVVLPDFRHAEVLRMKYFMLLGDQVECDVT